MNKRTLLISLMAFLFLTGANLVTANVDNPPLGRSDGEPAAIDPAAAYLHMLRQNQLSGMIDPMAVQMAYRQSMQMQMSKKTSNLNLNLTSVGPDNYGGRTRAIIIDKTNPNTIYAGSSGGGVWKSLSNGSSWVQIPVNGNPSRNMQVSCMLQTPAGTLYAGTGEGWYTNYGIIARGAFYGSGLYKSTNGTSFDPIPGTDNWKFINELAYHQNRLWVATEQGLFYSDTEQNWILAKDAAGNDLNGNATDVQIGSNGIIVAAVNNLCYVSEAGSVNAFISHSTGTTGKLPITNVGRAEFAIAPSNPDIIYASLASQIGAVLGIYRSIDKGVTWSIIGPGASASFGVFSFPTGATIVYEGMFNNTISVWPSDPDIIVVGGVDLWQGNKVSNEGFFSWTKTTSHAFDPLSGLGPLFLHKGINQIAWHPTTGNEAYFATDGGVFRLVSSQGFQGKHKNYVTNHYYTVHAGGDGAVMGGTVDNGVMLITGKGNSAQEGQIVFNGPGSHSLFSLIDHNVFIVSRAGGPVSRTIDYGLDFSATFGTNINMNSVTGAYLAPIALWESFYDYTSLDSVWYIADTTYYAGDNIEVRSHNAHYPFNVAAPYTINKGDSLRVQDPVVSRFFYGGNNGIWMTDMILDFTDLPRWAKVANFVGTIQTMSVSKNGNYLYAGTQNGFLLRLSGISSYSNDSTFTITMDTIGSWPDRVITSIAVSPSNANRLMVTLGNYGNTDYVFGTNNVLDPSPSFTSWQGQLPAMPVYASLIELNDANRLLLGTETGLFSAYYDGTTPTWTAETNGLPSVPIFQLYQQTTLQHTKYVLEIVGLDSIWRAFPGVSNYGVIYIATQGRGVYTCNTFVGIDKLPQKPETSMSALTIYPNPAKGMANLMFNVATPSNVNYQIYDLSGRLLKSVDLAEKASGTYDLPINLNGMKEGVYILKLNQGSSTSKSVKLIVK